MTTPDTSNDQRLLGCKFSRSAFATMPVTKSFLDLRPILKTDAPDELTPAIYYTEADIPLVPITLEFALRKVCPTRVRLLREEVGQKPITIGTLDQFEGQPLPTDMTHALFFLSPRLTQQEYADLVRNFDKLNQQIIEHPEQTAEEVNQAVADGGYTPPPGPLTIETVVMYHDEAQTYLETVVQ